ncbi:MAG: hypothetical protein QOF36_2629 [Microbacteriaceae bacterium]|jgi:hypothetical protein|nr:hypothetical protein [Microbacteriaceae bacterium]
MPDRKTTVTLSIQLEGDDTQSDPEDLVDALRTKLEGFTVRYRRRPVMTVTYTDEPIHMHDHQRGRRV